MQGKISKREQLIFLALAALVAVAAVIYPLWLNGGIFHIADDFDTQMLPFTYNLRESFKNGLNSYSWDIDLGTSMFHAYAYYGLGTPFFFLLALFPQNMVPAAIGFVLALKYVVASYTALLFLSRFTDNSRAAMCGAYLYAFSGYQSVNLIFYFFHDVVAFFPLMLLALEDMIRASEADDKKKLYRSGILFSAFVCLNCVSNYFFFVQSTLLLVVYFIARVNKKITLKKILSPLSFGIVGGLMSMATFLPSMLYILSNKRSQVNWKDVFSLYDPEQLMFILKGFVLPPEAMIDNTAFLEHKCTSTSNYLPFVGLFLVICYLYANRNWLSRLIEICFVLSFFPLGNGAFFLFTLIDQRWWYLLVMMMALASVKVLEDPKRYPLKKAYVTNLAVITVFVILSMLVRGKEGEMLIFHKDRFLLEAAAVYLCATAVLLILSYWKRDFSAKLITACICLAAFLSTLYVEHTYIKASPVEPYEYVNTYRAAQVMPEIPDRYRYRNYASPLIAFSQNKNTNGLSTYTSTGSNRLSEFDDLFGFYQKDNRLNKNNIPGLPEFLGGRYLWVSDIETEENFKGDAIYRGIESQIEDVDGVQWRLLEYFSCPIGFSQSRVLPKSEFDKLEKEVRGIALLYALVVPDELVGDYADVATACSAEDVMSRINEFPENAQGEELFKNPCIDLLTLENNENAITDFSKSPSGFKGVTDYPDERVVVLQIPSEEGWRLKVDDAPARVVNYYGLMQLRVPAGHHEFSATYSLPGLSVGICVSIIGWLIFVGLIIATRHKSAI